MMRMGSAILRQNMVEKTGSDPFGFLPDQIEHGIDLTTGGQNFPMIRNAFPADDLLFLRLHCALSGHPAIHSIQKNPYAKYTTAAPKINCNPAGIQ